MYDNQKYWYFRFPNTFFHRPEIKYLLAEENGEKYLIILLKLYAESTEEHGILKIQYNPFHNDGLKKLSVLIDENKDNLKGALEYFVNNDFLKIQNDEKNDKVILHFHHVKNAVGISSKRADKERERYQMQKKDEPKKFEYSPKPELPERTPAEEYKQYGRFENVSLTDSEYNELLKKYENAEFMITRLSIWKAAKQIDIKNDFAQIISFATKDGVLRNKEKEESRELYKKALEKEEAKLKQQDMEAELNEKYKARYPEYAQMSREKALLVRKALLLKGEEKAELKIEIDKLFEKMKEFKSTHSVD